MSRASDLVSALARRARTLPVGQETAGRFAGRLRASRTARTVVSRMFDFDDSGIGGTVFLGAGRLLGGLGLESLPIVLVSLVDTAPDDVPALLEQVAQEQVLTGGFRPVLLIDADHFAAVRQYGWPVEHVVARTDWDGDDDTWRAYLADRVRRMRRDYSAAGMVDLGHAPEAGLLFLSTLDAVR